MSLPSELKLPAAIEMMCMTSAGPKVLAGCISATGAQGIIVDANGPVEDVLPGSKVVLSSTDKTIPRISATVVLCKGNRLTLSEPESRPREKRLYPRLHGNISLRFQEHNPTDGDLEIRRWLENGTGGTQPWHEPDPFMNFSVNGLLFEGTHLCTEGGTLYLEFGVGSNPERWRCTATVVRVFDPDQDVHRTAINFDSLPDGAIDAMSNYTIKIQEALM